MNTSSVFKYSQQITPDANIEQRIIDKITQKYPKENIVHIHIVNKVYIHIVDKVHNNQYHRVSFSYIVKRNAPKCYYNRCTAFNCDGYCPAKCAKAASYNAREGTMTYHDSVNLPLL